MIIHSWNVLVILLIAAIGYLFGNIQTSLIISKLAFSDDVRKYGSGNAGSTNMTRVFGLPYGLMTFIADGAKALAAFFVGRLLGGAIGLNVDDAALGTAIGGYIGGVASVYGHCYPVFCKFKGGKGAACCFALCWCICWQAAIAASVLFFAIFMITKKVSLMSVAGSIIFAIFTAICCIIGWAPWYALWYTLAAITVLIIRHHENIKRLIKGEESKLDLTGVPLHEKNKDQ